MSALGRTLTFINEIKGLRKQQGLIFQIRTRESWVEMVVLGTGYVFCWNDMFGDGFFAERLLVLGCSGVD